MRWKSNRDTMAWQRKFAWLPTLMDDNETYVWLTFYWRKPSGKKWRTHYGEWLPIYHRNQFCQSN